MSAQDQRLRIAGILISLLLHALVLISVSETRVRARSEERTADQPVRVSFNFPAPPEVTEPIGRQPESPPEPRAEPKPEPKPEIAPTPQAKPKPKPKPKPKSKPKLKPKPTPTPVAKPRAKPERKSNPNPKSIADTAPTPKQHRKVASSVPAAPATPRKTKAAYLNQLLALVEARKQYPRSARRKGVEGRIKVSFVLLESGRIEKLSLSGGHKLLRRAARKAVEAALPLPSPPAELKAPFKVAFAMEFELR